MLDRTRQIDEAAPGGEVSISARVPLSMLHALAAGWDADAEALTRAAGLDPTALADPDGRVPGPQMEALWHAAVAATGDAHLGLRLGAAADIASLGVVGYVLQSTSTLGAALDAFARYVTLFTDGLRARVVRPPVGAFGGEAVLEFVAVGTAERNYLLRSPRYPMEATVAGALVIAGALVGDTLPPASLEFAHDAEADAPAVAAQVLGTPVDYGSDSYRFRFAAAALDWPVLRASPALLSAFEAQAAAAIEVFSARRTRPVSEGVLRAVTEQLRGQAPAVDEVADALAMGVRTLQRRLEDEGSSYSALLDEARHALALRHLGRSDVPVAEIAFLLGFSEPSAFTRAFRRWTGDAPTAYRRRAAASASDGRRTLGD